MPQEPKLLHSELTGNVYIVTKYKDLGKGRYEAHVKHDVTGEFEIIALKKQQSGD